MINGLWTEMTCVIAWPRHLGAGVHFASFFPAVVVLETVYGGGRITRWRDPGSLSHQIRESSWPASEFVLSQWHLRVCLGFPGGSEVKASACNAGDWVRSLGWEDPLEKEMAIHSSIIAWRIPRMEEPGGLQSMGSQRVGHDWGTSLCYCNIT